VSVSTISYVVWAAIGVGALLLWWLSYLRPAAAAHPGEVVGRLATSPVVRVILVLGFMWLGWHLLAR
jgi:Family of unknown function (DUF6186)